MTQEKMVLEYMKTHKGITALGATRLGIMRLAARISDLRGEGHIIDTEIEKRNGKHYARYYLIKEAK